jgi:NitT/TauT family transport system permease protein
MPTWSQLAEGFGQACKARDSNSLLNAFDVEVKPSDTWYHQVWDRISTTWLFNDMLATYSRLFFGLGISCLVSIVVGIAMGCYEYVAAFLNWPLSLFSRIPGTAMLACFFGLSLTGEPLFVSMIVFGAMPMLALSIYLCVKHEIKKEEIDKAYTLGAGSFEVISNVIFPKILPKILENIRLQIGPAMVCLIAAEMLIAEVGMGYQIRMASKNTKMAIVYDYLAILGISGLILDAALLNLRRKVSPWFSRFK